MKPHKYAELIKAWADGATIQAKSKSDPYDTWDDIESQHIYWGDEDNWFRIKPESKPDVVADVYIQYFAESGVEMYKAQTIKNLQLTFNFWTGELKSAEVLK